MTLLCEWIKDGFSGVLMTLLCERINNGFRLCFAKEIETDLG